LVRKILAIGAAAAVGALTTMAIATPASAGAMSSPTASFADKCDSKGHVVVTFTAPKEATQTDTVVVGLLGTNKSATLPTSTGARTVDIEITSTVELTAAWANNGSNLGPIEGAATHTWVFPANCKPDVKITAPTCANPYQSIVISNPAGANPISITINGASNSIPGGENGGLLNTSQKITWSFQGHGNLSGIVKDSGTSNYVPPVCDGQTVTPKPQPGTHHHGKGPWNGAVPVVNAGGNGGGSSTAAAPANNSDDAGLPVTGANVATIAAVGLVLAFAGVFLVLRAHRRRVRFTTNG
jgi:hypothetical protein